MLLVMNATAQVSTASISGPKLDNRRVLAALVDLGIVLAGTLVILVAADALGDSGEMRGALGAVIVGWALYYHFAMESGDGQTVGKKLMKIRVVLADGRPAGMREIAVRTVLRVVDGLGAYIVGLIVMLATGERRQRVGDLAAGTMVVDATAMPAAPPAPVVAPVEEPAAEEDLSAPEAPAVPEMSPFDPPVAGEPVDEVEDEPVEDEVAPVEDVEIDEPVEDEPVDYTEPVVDEPVAPDEAEPVVDEPAAVEAVEPVEEELVEPVTLKPVEDEPSVPVALVAPVEDEPVAALTIVEDVEDDAPDEPAVPLAIVENEPAAEELPEVSTPALEALAHDVAAAGSESDDAEPADEPITLRSVETVSAIDLVMGGAEGDDSSEPDHAPEGPAAS
jgi:uncharacterized RDD family membrane protein YckC